MLRCLLTAVLVTALPLSPLSAAIRVACVGDSITAGDLVEPAEKYPAVLGKLLGTGYQVRNFGRPASAQPGNGTLRKTSKRERMGIEPT